MIKVTLRTLIPAARAAAVFEQLRDFAKYPTLTDAVREVEVTESDDGSAVSRWSILFRGGVLRWTERDTFEPAAGKIHFTQLEGDLQTFSGCWSAYDTPEGACVDFAAEAELGIPSLASLLEPAAARALAQSVEQILRGLFGPELRLRDAAAPARSPATTTCPESTAH